MYRQSYSKQQPSMYDSDRENQGYTHKQQGYTPSLAKPNTRSLAHQPHPSQHHNSATYRTTITRYGGSNDNGYGYGGTGTGPSTGTCPASGSGGWQSSYPTLIDSASSNPSQQHRQTPLSVPPTTEVSDTYIYYTGPGWFESTHIQIS